MNLTKDQQEKLTLIIQAALGILVIALSVRSSAKVQTAQAKKLAKKDARNAAKLNKQEYRLKSKLLKKKYKQKMKNAKGLSKSPKGSSV